MEGGNIRHKAWCLAIAKPEEGENVVLKECNDKNSLLVSKNFKCTILENTQTLPSATLGGVCLRAYASPGILTLIDTYI